MWRFLKQSSTTLQHYHAHKHVQALFKLSVGSLAGVGNNPRVHSVFRSSSLSYAPCSPPAPCPSVPHYITYPHDSPFNSLTVGKITVTLYDFWLSHSLTGLYLITFSKVTCLFLSLPSLPPAPESCCSSSERRTVISFYDKRGGEEKNANASHWRKPR